MSAKKNKLLSLVSDVRVNRKKYKEITLDMFDTSKNEDEYLKLFPGLYRDNFSNFISLFPKKLKLKSLKELEKVSNFEK